MSVDVAAQFAARVQAIRAGDEEKFEWMQTLQEKLVELTKNYDVVRKDLDRERVAARAFQGDVEAWERRFGDLKQSVDRSSFVLVLVDADADEYMFKDEYYSSMDGGRRAAVDLSTAVKLYLKQAHPQLADVPVIAKGFANGDGLSLALAKAKGTKPVGSPWDFAKGFSQAYSMFDFVLVGHGKDRADEKIKGLFKQFVENPTCAHILFAACHDNGYVRLLEKYMNGDSVVDRVTLVRPNQIAKEFGALKFKSITMDTVFRGKPLGPVNTMMHGMIPTMPRAQSVNLGTELTWAARAKSPQDRPGASNSQGVQTVQVERVLVNEHGQRIDAQLPQSSQQNLDSWQHKIKVARMKYCRMHQFYGACKSPNCEYSHGPLSDGEKLEYRRLLRAEVCHVGLQCRDSKCVYGHNCSCTKKKCAFSAEMHNVDSTTWTVQSV